MIQLSATNYITDALCDIGALRLGQTPNADLLAGGKRALDQMLELWLLDELLVYAVAAQIFTLTAGVQSYTIGPGGQLAAPRPTRIEDANVILNNVTPTVRAPLDLINADEWSAIRVQQLPFAIPLKLYYDRNFDANGNATINLWPGPQINYGLELFTWQQLTSFADLTTPYGFPPGYSLALRKNLAVTLIPMMKAYIKITAPELDALRAEAMQARAALESYNAPDPILVCDPAFSGRGRGGFNYATGDSSSR